MEAEEFIDEKLIINETIEETKASSNSCQPNDNKSEIMDLGCTSQDNSGPDKESREEAACVMIDCSDVDDESVLLLLDEPTVDMIIADDKDEDVYLQPVPSEDSTCVCVPVSVISTSVISTSVISTSVDEPTSVEEPTSVDVPTSVEVPTSVNVPTSTEVPTSVSAPTSAELNASTSLVETESEAAVVESAVVDGVTESFDVNNGTLMVLDEWVDEEELVDPDEEEHFLLNMPSLSVIDSCLSKEEYTISVQPLSLSDLNNPKLSCLLTKKSCDEVRISFTRSQSDDSLNGLLIMNFSSANDAKQAELKLKQFRKSLEIKRKFTAEFDADRETKLWLRKESLRKNIVEKLVLVKNVPLNATIKDLRQIFPDARTIIPHPTLSTKNKSSLDDGISFVLLRNQEAVKKAVAKYASNQPMIQQKRVKVYSYFEPTVTIPNSLLKLKERHAVFTYQEKIMKKLEKAKTDSSISTSRYEKELDQCKSTISADNRTRKALHLDCPEFDALKNLAGLKVLNENRTERLLKDLKIVSYRRTRSRSRSRNNHRRSRSRSRHDHKSSRSGYHHQRSRSRSAKRTRTKSPSQNQDKNKEKSTKKTTTSKKAEPKATIDAVSSSSAVIPAKVTRNAANNTAISDHNVSTSTRVAEDSEKAVEPAVTDQHSGQSDAVPGDAASQLASNQAQENSDNQNPVSLLLKLASILSQKM